MNARRKKQTDQENGVDEMNMMTTITPAEDSLTSTGAAKIDVAAWRRAKAKHAASEEALEEYEIAFLNPAVQKFDAIRSGVNNWRELTDAERDRLDTSGLDDVQKRFDQLVFDRMDELRNLFATPAPDLDSVRYKLKVFEREDAQDLVYAKDFIASLIGDVERLSGPVNLNAPVAPLFAEDPCDWPSLVDQYRQSLSDRTPFADAFNAAEKAYFENKSDSNESMKRIAEAAHKAASEKAMTAYERLAETPVTSHEQFSEKLEIIAAEEDAFHECNWFTGWLMKIVQSDAASLSEAYSPMAKRGSPVDLRAYHLLEEVGCENEQAWTALSVVSEMLHSLVVEAIESQMIKRHAFQAQCVLMAAERVIRNADEKVSSALKALPA